MNEQINYRKTTPKHFLRNNIIPKDAPPSIAYIIPGLPKYMQPTIKDIISYICELIGEPMENVIMKGRKREHVNGRKLICLFASDIRFLNMSLTKTGLLFHPPKDHATVIYNTRKAWIHIETEPEFRRIFLAVKERFFIS